MIEYCVYNYHETMDCVEDFVVDRIFHGFKSLEECKQILDSISDFLEENNYLVIKFENGKPTEVSGVYFVTDKEAFMDVAEYDFRAIASMAFGINLI